MKLYARLGSLKQLFHVITNRGSNANMAVSIVVMFFSKLTRKVPNRCTQLELFDEILHEHVP